MHMKKSNEEPPPVSVSKSVAREKKSQKRIRGWECYFEDLAHEYQQSVD